MDKVVLTISGVRHRLWRAVGQTAMVLDILVQSRRAKKATVAVARKLAGILHRICKDASEFCWSAQDATAA